MKTFLTIILSTLVVGAAFAQGGTTGGTTSTTTTTNKGNTGNTNANWATFSDAQVSVQYPKDWELNQSGQSGSTFFLFSALESSNDYFKENINLIVQDLSMYGMADVTLDGYTALSILQLPNLIQNNKLITSSKEKANGKNYHKIVYTGTQMNYSLKWLQHYWVENGKAYILTFTAEEATYDDYINEVERIFKTFRVK